MRIDSVEKSFSSTAGASALTIAPSAPVLQNVRREAVPGYTLLITSLSTPRSVTELSLQFNTTPAVQVSCGTVPGCTASGSTLTFDVRGLFNNWFAQSSQFGSLSTLKLPLSLQGTVRGSVSVSLRNDLGISNSISFTIP
jgi:hypothetical protein